MQCVKASLSGRLAPGLDEYERLVITSVLQKQIQSISEMTVRGSLIVNEVLLYCLRYPDKYELPKFTDAFFNCCFLVGLKKCGARESKEAFVSLVKDVYEQDFADYPNIERVEGDGQAVTYAARTYGTNFKNSVTHAFFDRQKTFIKTWLKQNGYDIAPWIVQSKINGWHKPAKRKRDPEELPEAVKTFISDQRRLLG